MENLKHLRKEDNDIFPEYCKSMYRYEFTITYNPKYIASIEYAESMTDYVIMDIFKFLLRTQKHFRRTEIDNFNFNYVVEYQKNGYPHIHGTMFTHNRISPVNLQNIEKLCYRKYGRTDVYATDVVDRIHQNDHFNGTWQEYLKKEGEVKCYTFEQYSINEVDPILGFN